MTLDDATTVIARIAYRPGWTFTVTPRATGPHLEIIHPYGTELDPLPLLSAQNTRSLVLWVFNWVRDIEARHVDKEFAYAGQRIGKLCAQGIQR